MIKEIRGNVLDIDEGIIVHGCNSLGAMGAGIALQIKGRFPDVFNVYSRSLRSMGSITTVAVTPRKYIVNAITQKSVGDGRQVSYDAIEECFAQIASTAETFAERGLYLPICFPMIGAGLGGGNWKIIETIIDQTVPDRFDKRLYVL